MEKRRSDFKTLVPKGFLRVYTLKLLKQKPLCGYEIMKEIKSSTGFWKPSPGTIYPLINSLEKEGLIKKQKVRNKNIYKLTKKGKERIQNLEDVRQELKKKFLEVFSNLLNIDKKELKNIFTNFKKNKIACSLKPYFHEMNFLIIQASNNPKNFTKIEKILKETKAKIRKLI